MLCVGRLGWSWALVAVLLAGWPVLAGPRQAGRFGRLLLRARSQSSVDTAPRAAQTMPLMYPVTPRSDHVDVYHGVRVPDPYRWLEELDSPQTRAWIEAQNRLTFAWLAQVPHRPLVRRRLETLWNYERYGLPVRRGDRYFFTRNDGLQNQSALYVLDRLDGTPRLLLDPNKLSDDGTIALSGWVPSEDGRLVAVGLASAGSDWQTWRVLEVESGQWRPDELHWIKFSSVSWLPDGSGFYYSRYDEPPPGSVYTGTNYYQKLYFHSLGQPQSEDRLVYHRPDQKEWGFRGEVSEDGQILWITVWRGSEPKSQVFYQRLGAADAPVEELITGFDADYDVISSEGQRLWVATDLEAPRGRIVEIDLAQPQRAAWRDVVPQNEDTLQAASLVADHFLVRYLHDARSRVRVFDRQGRPVREIALPGLGVASGFAGRRTDTETFYAFSSFTVPGSIYRYDVIRGESTLFREPRLAFDPSQYQTQQLFYTSKDGTRVPLFLVGRRDVPRDGRQPTILYGYGGFNIPQTPTFSVSTIAWLEMGGLYAVANLRGGGEYGREWHEAGRRERKQNVFDDFIAAAEFLIAQGYTSPQHLAIRGGSNGGLLVGAVMTQRPELFAAAVPAVGVMDMLRFHKFTIGWAWVGEFGSSDDPEQFRTLYAYSPLHNLRPGRCYPATLITTADHDDRVVPAHSFKFAAALQAAQAADRPVLIRIETRAGHGAGTPTTKQIEAAADVLAFLAAELKMSVPAQFGAEAANAPPVPEASR